MTYDELRAEVSRHCKLYYDLSRPEISDKEFDSLYDMLEQVEKTQGWAAYDSPTKTVGGAGGKVTHPIKLYSLNKVYDQKEVDPSFDVETPKIDGANLTLVYVRGRLRLALTRGNGEMGDNVTHLAKGISNLPQKIQTEFEHVVVNGECVTASTVKNFRNYVSGALGLKSLDEFIERNILFIAHDMLGTNLNYIPRITILQNMGFATVLDKDLSKYPCDGVVFRINDNKKCVALGYTSKYPKFAVALKPREIATAITTLQAVEWVIGRTGTVNPTAVIDTVTIEDANITRLTLHNIGFIEEHNLGLGDLIEIERAGGVIPKFLRVLKHSDHNLKITTEQAEKAIGTLVKRVGPKLFVADKSVVNTTKVLEHFIKTLEIKGIGPANIAKLELIHPTDLYSPQNWDSLGAISTGIEEELEKSKNKPYELVLAALGIPGVGKSVAKLITTHIPSFDNLRDIETKTIKGIGPATITSILDWLDENEDWVKTLPLQLRQTLAVSRVINNQKKKVCITGKMDLTRSELAEKLEHLGYGVLTNVTKECEVLISGGDTTSSKYVKAKEMGITILDYRANKKAILEGNF